MIPLISRSVAQFLMVCETGNLTEAAMRCNVTQPAVSKSIQKLEANIGAKIFERGSAGLVLTPTGDVLRRHSEAMQTQGRLFEADVAAIQEGRHGRIRMGVGHGFASTMLPRLMAEFVQRFPTIDIEFEIAIADELYPRLVDGKIDILLASTSSFAPSSDIVLHPLSVMNMAVFARDGHPIWRSRIRPVDVAAYHWYLFVNDVEGLKAVDRWFNARGVESPRVALRTSALVTLLELTCRTDGLVYLAESLTSEAVARGLQPLPISPPIWSFPTGLMVRRQAALVRPILFIVDHCVQMDAST